MISTAYLRVFTAGDAGSVVALDDTPIHGRVVRSDGRFLWHESLREDAFVTTWNGIRYVCPRNTRLRMVEGVLAFSGMYPKIPLVDEAEREAFKEELAGLRSAGGRSHILASPWHVPLRWFGAFNPSERDLYDGSDGLRIRYRTALGEAIDRIGWAVRVLDGAGFPSPVVDQVSDLEHWLGDFAVGSMLELDYATVSRQFTDADLAFDESAVDVRESLMALERGDTETSREAYGRVAERWASRQALTFAN